MQATPRERIPLEPYSPQCIGVDLFHSPSGTPPIDGNRRLLKDTKVMALAGGRIEHQEATPPGGARIGIGEEPPPVYRAKRRMAVLGELTGKPCPRPSTINRDEQKRYRVKAVQRSEYLLCQRRGSADDTPTTRQQTTKTAGQRMSVSPDDERVFIPPREVRKASLHEAMNIIPFTEISHAQSRHHAAIGNPHSVEKREPLSIGAWINVRHIVAQ